MFQHAALELVEQEIERTIQKMGSNARFNSTHEGWAVIYEELMELFDEIRANNDGLAVEEAIQVAAMATRFVMDFGGDYDRDV